MLYKGGRNLAVETHLGDKVKKYFAGFGTAVVLFSAFLAAPADASGGSVASQLATLFSRVGSGTDSSLAKKLLPKTEKTVYQIICKDFIGSGFGVDIQLSPAQKAEGYSGAVITNHHVIADCTFKGTEITVSQKNRNLGGKVWAWDKDSDLALLLTQGVVSQLPVASSKPSRGDFVMALGSPYGIEGSISTGIVSNLDEDTILTDAAVDPGNSGCPLVNSKGQLVGINAWGWEGSKGNSHAIKPGLVCRKILICAPGTEFLTWSK